MSSHFEGPLTMLMAFDVAHVFGVMSILFLFGGRFSFVRHYAACCYGIIIEMHY